MLTNLQHNEGNRKFCGPSILFPRLDALFETMAYYYPSRTPLPSHSCCVQLQLRRLEGAHFSRGRRIMSSNALLNLFGIALADAVLGSFSFELLLTELG